MVTFSPKLFKSTSAAEFMCIHVLQNLFMSLHDQSWKEEVDKSQTCGPWRPLALELQTILLDLTRPAKKRWSVAFWVLKTRQIQKTTLPSKTGITKWKEVRLSGVRK